MVQVHEVVVGVLGKDIEVVNNVGSASKDVQYGNNNNNNNNNNNSEYLCMINENRDVLIEILKRVDDDRSLGVAACVCRLWCELISRNDAVWEHLCFRQYQRRPTEGVRRVVVALGGYRRLYMSCVKPLLLMQLAVRRNKRRVNVVETSTTLSLHHYQLSLSLFCVEYYERVLLLTGADSASSSLMINLCKPLNV